MNCYHKGCTEDKAENESRAERKLSTPRYYFPTLYCVRDVHWTCICCEIYKIGYLGKGQWSWYSLSVLCVSVTLCASLLPFLTTHNIRFLALFVLAFMSSSYAQFCILNFSRSTAYIRARVKTWFMLFCPCSHITPSSQFWLNIFFLLTLFNNVCCIFIMPKMYVILHMILL